MKVITLLNEKGGVGKTTLATHVAAGLALHGYKVILMDADPQGNATSALGLAKKPALHDLIVRNARWQETIQIIHPDVYSPPNSTPQGQLFAVPSNVETRNIANTISDGLQVKKRLVQLDEVVDFIIVDTSPTPSLLHASILMASDYLLLPTECEMYSFEGLAESILHNQQAQDTARALGLPAVEVMGIIPTMYRPKTVTHSTALEALKERYGDLIWQPITNRIIWAEAALNKQLIYGFAPESKAAKEAHQLIQRIVEVVYERST